MTTDVTPEQVTPAEDQTVEVYFNGKTYRADDLTIGDIELMEDELGEPIEAVDWRMKKVVLWLVWLVRRRDEPDLTLDDLRNLKLSTLTGADDRPTETTDPDLSPGTDTEPETKSGSRGSAASTGSTRGTSTSSGRSKSKRSKPSASN